MFKRTIAIVMLSIFVSGKCEIKEQNDLTYFIQMPLLNNLPFFKCQNSDDPRDRAYLKNFFCGDIELNEKNTGPEINPALCVAMFREKITYEVKCDKDGAMKPMPGTPNNLCDPKIYEEMLGKNLIKKPII